MKILLDEIMKSRGLSERQVSIMTGLSKSTIHDIKTGTMPRIDTLVSLAVGLNMKVRDLTDSPDI